MIRFDSPVENISSEPSRKIVLTLGLTYDTPPAGMTRAQEILGWRQNYGDLTTIIETAWRWHEAHPDGF